jgi:hypothetical protein
MPTAVETRKRLLEDFEFYAKHCVKIRTKEQKIVPLLLNRAQRHLLSVCMGQLERRGYIRLVILKGRQMGSSTFVEAFLYWWVSQRKAHKALVVAHDIPATTTIFEMTRRLHENCPEHVKPATKIAGRRELVFGRLDSGYRVATAGGDGIVRGDTITAAHLSEVAWWPAGSAKANYSGLMDAVPSGRSAVGTVCFEESTANGFNLFWEHCDSARKGESDFEFVFLPWFWHVEYEAMQDPEGFEQTPGEIELNDAIEAEFGERLSNAQLQWRREKIAEKGLDLFRQEYPSTADEAFLTSGRPVFNPDRIKEALEKKREPIARMSLCGVVDGNDIRTLEWDTDPRGELAVYRKHDPNETYFVGADVGGGVRRDWSVAAVMDSKRRLVAVWRSDRYLPDYFGSVLANLGTFYNDAQVICERNNHGILTNYVLEKGGDQSDPYPYVYREVIYDKVTDTETEHVGFMTSQKSKPLVIDKLRAEVRDRTVEIPDETTLHEMKQFVIKDNGKMEAEEGHHDDCVVALALSNHINEGPVVLIVTPDEDYITPE